jgi:hypothetical protein
MIKIGGFYVIDDMLPAADWPNAHAEKANALMDQLVQYGSLIITMMDWSTGVVVCTKNK